MLKGSWPAMIAKVAAQIGSVLMITAALVGETSDNLPGVPKVGEKTAVKWLTQWGTLDALLENAEKITGVVGGNLREHLDDVRRNRSLNGRMRLGSGHSQLGRQGGIGRRRAVFQRQAQQHHQILGTQYDLRVGL